MSADPDKDLLERFGRLREQDRAATPAFESVMRPTRVRPPAQARHIWVMRGLVVAGVLVLVLLLRPPAHDAPAVATAAWHSPTDFLLAQASGSMQNLSQAPTPTAGLGPPSFKPERENR